MPIRKGDRLRTALRARIELEMPDGTVIKVNENSVFDVREIKTPEKDNEDKMSFTLWAGNIWAKFKKVVSSRQQRQIESPSAVVAIRGTTLEMDVDQSQTTTVSVTEGKVAVTSKDAEGEVIVGSNQQTRVEKGKAPTPPSAYIPVDTDDDDGATQSGFIMNINAGKLQFTDPAVLASGAPVSGRVTPGSRITANGVPVNVAPNGSFAGRVTVREGLNTISVTAEKDGESIKKDLRIFINTKAPQIQLSRPVTNRFLNRRDYSLSGAVFDLTPQDKIKVYINDEMVAEVMVKGSFNRTIILREGKNNIRVSATDRSGNTTEITERMFLDTVKPIITITEPARELTVDLKPPYPPDSDVRKDYFEKLIRGIIIDPAPSSGLKLVSINGKEIKPRSDGSFETIIRIQRGQKQQIIIFAEDLSGNISRDNSRTISIP